MVAPIAPVPITLYGTAGATVVANLTFTRPDAHNVQQPVDLTGASLWLTVKYRANDPDPGLVQLTVGDGIVIVGSPTLGHATAAIPADVTTGIDAPISLYYDVKVKESNEVESVPIAGFLNLSAPITLAS